MTPQPAFKHRLRRLRAALAAAIAATIATFPSLEAIAIRLGRAAARRSHRLAGLYWFVQEDLLARLRLGGERFRPVHVHGCRLQLDITDATGRMPYFYATPYEAAVTDAIVTALQPGDVFLDVGANIGYFTVLAAQVVGAGGLVIAFEPHGGARAMLETIVLRNGMTSRVEIVPLALADAAGEAVLFEDEGISMHSTIEPALSPMRHVAALRPGFSVGLTTLDDWMASRPGLAQRVRCVKIDVEGAEARVLAGMPRLLAEPRLTIVCETTTGGAADRSLGTAGFHRERLEAGAESYGNFLYVRP
ncbi:MAG TPA: FkbM family methyltransferase [Vicinamibacterales bacterium]|jgi:FkbM family methyltransferase